MQATKALINRSAQSAERVNAAMDREQHFTVQRMTPRRGGDAQLGIAQYQQALEGGWPVRDWPYDSTTTVGEKSKL